ncbi:hypothetical protein ACFXKF_40010 [Streptomyces scopuliridis]|uniref:hypothetical protein n=1 Tax=Streptomyces scopuliridis TaxID=452529 RepID=UPI0036CA921A
MARSPPPPICRPRHVAPETQERPTPRPPSVHRRPPREPAAGRRTRHRIGIHHRGGDSTALRCRPHPGHLPTDERRARAVLLGGAAAGSPAELRPVELAAPADRVLTAWVDERRPALPALRPLRLPPLTAAPAAGSVCRCALERASEGEVFTAVDANRGARSPALMTIKI